MVNWTLTPRFHFRSVLRAAALMMRALCPGGNYRVCAPVHGAERYNFISIKP